MFASAAVNVSRHFFGQDHDQISFLQQFSAPPTLPQLRADTGDALEEFSAIMLHIEYTRQERIHSSPVQILSLRRFRTRKETDAHDKVFAFFGLASTPVLGPIHINYTMTKREILTATTIHIIQTTQSLSVLHGNTASPTANDVKVLPKASLLKGLENISVLTDLPSWVVDWSISSDDSVMDLDRLSRLDYYTAGDPYSHVHIHAGDILKLKGYIVGTVASVIEGVASNALERQRQTVLSWHTWWVRGSHQERTDDPIFYAAVRGLLLHRHQVGVRSSFEGSDYDRTEAATIMSACKTWLADTTSERNRKTAMIGELVTDSYEEPERILLEKNTCLHSIRSAASSRRFFTFRAYKPFSVPILRSQPRSTAIGTGPVDVEVGDLIYIPDGSRVPLIIRAAKHSTGRTSIFGSGSSPKHVKRTLDA